VAEVDTDRRLRRCLGTNRTGQASPLIAADARCERYAFTTEDTMLRNSLVQRATVMLVATSLALGVLGSPHEGYTEQEAQQNYQQIAPQLPPEQYQQAAQQTFEQMSPQEREQFAQYVHQQAQQQGVNIPGMNAGQYQQYQDPGTLAQMTGQLHQQQPGMLQRLLGGGNSGLDGMSPLAKMALGGIAAMAVKNLVGGKL
jgi:hypothetical protein